MRKLQIDSNESGQRLDRFLKKYLNEAPNSFIFKMLRKKNIKLNGKKAKPEEMLEAGDEISLFLAEETIEKFRKPEEPKDASLDLDIVYEDENIILMNKPVGLLSHFAKGCNDNLVDRMIAYLVSTGAYRPEEELTFSPSIANRLDRNTSGIVIGCKNYESLKNMNEAIKDFKVDRFYRTIVLGELEIDETLGGFLEKNEDKNKVKISEDLKDGKEVRTRVKTIEVASGFSYLDIELITGRTHQIRAHLSSIGHPVLGDKKYGRKKVNQDFEEKYRLENQFLHSYRVCFRDMPGNLAYLNGREFLAKLDPVFEKIRGDLF